MIFWILATIFGVMAFAYAETDIEHIICLPLIVVSIVRIIMEVCIK